MQERQQAQPVAKSRSSSRGARIAMIGLIEIGLIALIVLVLSGERVAAVADVVAQVPGGRLVVAGGMAVLLLVAALVMTIQVSD
jgi:uncharacterized membrane protein